MTAPRSGHAGHTRGAACLLIVSHRGLSVLQCDLGFFHFCSSNIHHNQQRARLAKYSTCSLFWVLFTICSYRNLHCEQEPQGKEIEDSSEVTFECPEDLSIRSPVHAFVPQCPGRFTENSFCACILLPSVVYSEIIMELKLHALSP